MEFEQLANLIQERCPQILRNSWKPVKAKQPSDNKCISKFGGSDPFRGANFQWPRCLDKKCGKEKSFICQINLGDLPADLQRHIGRDSGLFQCFWCTSMFDCDKWAAAKDGDEPSLNSNFRFISATEMTSQAEIIPKNQTKEERIEVGEEVEVESWVESAAKELPVVMEIMDNEKISSVVLAQPEITEDVLYEVEFCEGEDAEPIGTPLRGVKLGGYVAWFEGETAYTTCSHCEVDMDVTFLQLEYDRNVLRYDWDSGAACITFCPGCGKPDMYWRNNP